MISNNELNYNKLSDTYDKRYEYNKHTNITKAINRLIESFDYKSVLEIGSGTCFWLKNINNELISKTGLDISINMLKKSDYKNNKILVVNGDARFLPFKQHTFDFLFCVNVLHQIDNKRKTIEEAFRVLKNKGMLAVYTFDPRTEGDKWYLYDYFEGIREFDLNRFAPINQITKLLYSAGFRDVRVNTTEIVSDNKTGENVLRDPFLQKHGSSQTAILSESDYRKGIEKIKSKIKKDMLNGIQSVFPVRLTQFEISGMKI